MERERFFSFALAFPFTNKDKSFNLWQSHSKRDDVKHFVPKAEVVASRDGMELWFADLWQCWSELVVLKGRHRVLALGVYAASDIENRKFSEFSSYSITP